MGRETIRSRSHPVVRRLRALRDRRAEHSRELACLEGPKLVGEALRAGVRLVEVIVTPRAEASDWGRSVLRDLPEGTALHRVDESVLRALSELDHSPGVLGVAHRPVFDEAALFRGVPLLLVAVGVQDPGNLGALLRAAEAAGATGAWLTDGCADALSWKALRGSMGSAFRLPHRVVAGTADIVEPLRAHGVRLLAAVTREGDAYDQADLRGPIAVMVGAEGGGLPAEALDAADARVAIPLAGGVESLNVAVAAGVILFEAARQRRS